MGAFRTRGSNLREYEIGDIKMSGRATPGAGWLLCDGSAISRTTYAKLFAAIGTAFGVGDGSTTFNLPPFFYSSTATHAFPIGAGDVGTPPALGASGGSTNSGNGYAAVSDTGHYHDINAGSLIAAGTDFSASTGTNNANVSDSGHNHLVDPPYVAVNFFIKYA